MPISCFAARVDSNFIWEDVTSPLSCVLSDSHVCIHTCIDFFLENAPCMRNMLRLSSNLCLWYRHRGQCCLILCTITVLVNIAIPTQSWSWIIFSSLTCFCVQINLLSIHWKLLPWRGVSANWKSLTLSFIHHFCRHVQFQPGRHQTQ